MTQPRHRPRVYLAGPYSRGVPGRNVQEAIYAAGYLIRLGYAPLVPHLSHYIHDQFPQPYEVWLEICLAWIPCSEAVYRLPGESPGADRECELAASLGIPVVYSLLDLQHALPVKES